MPKSILQHSVQLADGLKTSVSLEPQFLAALKLIAQEQGCIWQDLVREVAANNPQNLSSTLRIYILEHYMGKAQSAPPLKLNGPDTRRIEDVIEKGWLPKGKPLQQERAPAGNTFGGLYGDDSDGLRDLDGFPLDGD